MKKIFHFILTAGLLSLSACTDQLNLEPPQSVPDQDALSTDSNVKKALLGAYDALSNAAVLGGDMQLYSELLAANGEIRWDGTFPEPREIFGKKITVTNGFVADTWVRSYKTINICNNVLSALDVVNDDDQDRIKGEALLIRAWTYFELVKLYGKPYVAGNLSVNLGVPIVLEPTTDGNSIPLPERATVGDVYELILTDLIEAEGLLPEENDVFANKTVAAAVLSRLYLQQEDYANARDAADRAINYGTNELVATYEEAFNNTENSTEDIFSFQVSDQDGDNDMHIYCSVPDYGGRDGDVTVLDGHIALYESGDDRLLLFYDGNAGLRTGKWKLNYRNVQVIRLAEMYLTRAESNFQESTQTGDTPLNDINLIRARVNLAPLGSLTIDDIQKERKLELAFEGQTIHDARRWKKTIDGLVFDADKMIFPIPQREINVNKNLDQNPGY